MKRRTKQIVLWLVLIVTALAIVSYFGLKISIIQRFSDPYLYISANPATGHEAWFKQEGFVDRGWTLFAKSEIQDKPMRVSELDWDGIFRLKGAEWSKDGQVIVATLGITALNWQEVRAFAYDFSKNQPVLPTGITRHTLPSSIDWLSLQSNIVSLVEDHGGFSGEFISRDIIMQSSKSIWVWQEP